MVVEFEKAVCANYVKRSKRCDRDRTSSIKFSDACIFVYKGAVQGNKFRLETGDRLIIEFI
ncbi:MAG: hypothetical protein V7K57_12870 [Nostoc sp.]|uniref:hypothetical protein n=1 Tax=Nostoc sp. TaxID=1180 RepID=UPI002FF59C4B